MRDSIPIADVAVKRLLLATDLSVASRAAFCAALTFAGQFGASMYVLHVFNFASCAASESGGLAIDLDSSYRHAEASVGLLVDEAQRAGVVCEGTLVTGRTPDCILDVLHSQSCDLVVLATKAIRGFDHLVFGPTAEAVIRSAGRPVLTVGPQVGTPSPHNHPKAHIALFATDFYLVTTEAIRYAALFAVTTNLPLHCLHVLPRALESTEQTPQILAVISEALKHLVAELDLGPLLPVYAVTYGSEVSNAIVEYARSHHAQLIVLGLRRASLAASHVPAHIAYRIITEAPCPVLTMAFPIEPDTSTAAEARQRAVTPTPVNSLSTCSSIHLS